MKRLYILLLLMPLLAWSCSEEEDTLPDQQKRILTFLTSSHSPRLVDEKDVEEGEKQPFFTSFTKSVYRYVDNYYDPNRPNWKEVGEDSKIAITFRAYVFNFQQIIDSAVPYFTNDPELEEFFYQHEGLTPGYWVFEPLKIDMATTDKINALRTALIGCREHDQVEVYMSYDAVYGEDYFNIIPGESPIAILLTINEVE